MGDETVAVEATAKSTGTVEPPNDSNTYFFEDEVFTVDKRGRVRLGVIISSGNLSDEDDEDYVDPGKVRVSMHPDGKEIVFPVSQVGLVDRTLAPGDVVRRLNTPKGQPKQFGYCQELTVCADMHVVGTRYVIRNVPAKRCAPLHRMTPGAVILDSWIGVSDMIKEKLVLQTSCGSLIEVVLCADQCPLWDLEDNPRGSYFSTPIFHVGQILVGPVAALENAKWLHTSPEMRSSRKNKTVIRKFIVQSVELHEVTIYWQIKPNVEVNSLDEISYSEPPKVVSGEDLKRIRPMNVFDEAMLQINDKHQVTIQAGDQIVTRYEWRKELSERYQLPRSGVNRSPNRMTGGGGVQVVVSGEEEKRDGVFLVPAVPPLNSRQNLKPPPVTRGHSLGKLEGEQKHHSQFLTVTADSRRSHSLDGATDSDATTDLDTYEDDESATSASGSEFSSNTPSSCSTTPRGSPKSSPLLANKLRKLHQSGSGGSSTGRRLIIRPRRESGRRDETPVKMPEPGQAVVARALVVYSTVNVLWQDGSCERGIPSSELFPVHTLDHHEFFPSDFVLDATSDKDTEDWHNYGVIQTMDHVGRLARVKWFETAKAYDQDPKFKGETQVSVYDLKDHPLFQNRPGTIVVRLRRRSADGEPEEDDEEEGDGGGQLGQVIDNSPEGKVKVVWVNKKVSSCWPQDIFELGNYDSGMFISHDHLTFGDVDDGADDSWETESEESHLGDQAQSTASAVAAKPAADRAYLHGLLGRLKASLGRLQSLFKMNPQIFNGNLVCDLMVLFKKCRYFDRLMDTQFFSEENFEGLVERVGKSAVMRQASRSGTSGGIAALAKDEVPAVVMTGEQAEEGFRNASQSTPIKGEKISTETKPAVKNLTVTAWPAEVNESKAVARKKVIAREDEYEDLDDEKRQSIKKGDSGHYSEIDDDHSSASSTAAEQNNKSSSKKETSNAAKAKESPANVNSLPVDAMCLRFCTLLVEQMGKAFHEINTTYCNPSSEWEVVKEEEQDDASEAKSTGANMEKSFTDDDLNASSGAAVADDCGAPAPPPEAFLVVDSAPTQHQFNLSLLQPKVPRAFFKAVKREHDLLRGGLPEGVWVRAYEERLDLFSVMIEGPKKTPYEDGMFLFDIQLGSNYPDEPPSCHYISYCHDRINPNLYQEGKVCVSLLGTWQGKGTEKWGPNSSLLQLIVSIQGLILVAEPYFNEAGYEKQVGTAEGMENSQIYNESVVIKLLQSMMKLLEAPPEIFRERILNHFKRRGQPMIDRISGWVELSKEGGDATKGSVPEFPLIPGSLGFCITVESLLGRFQQIVDGLAE